MTVSGSAFPLASGVLHPALNQAHPSGAAVCESAPWHSIGKTILQELLCVRVPLALPHGGASLRAAVCESAPWRCPREEHPSGLRCVSAPWHCHREDHPSGAAVCESAPWCFYREDHPSGAVPQGGPSLCRSFRTTPVLPASGCARLWLGPAVCTHRPPPALPGGCFSWVSAPSSPTSLLHGVCVSCSAVCVGSFTS